MDLACDICNITQEDIDEGFDLLYDIPEDIKEKIIERIRQNET